MKKSVLFSLLAAGSILSMSVAHAAPLDALLTANKKTTPGSFEIEASYDVMNSTVDIFDIRDNDEEFAGTNVGDYHGAHIRGGVALTPSLWLDGALWKRRIDYRQDEGELDSWQIGAQYKLFDALGVRPAMAVRLGLWGNSADNLSKTSPTRVQGVTLDSVNVQDGEDRQVQFDLIASWPVRDSMEVTAFAGAGVSETEIDSISGTASRDGCNYNLAFGRDKVVGTLAEPCGASVVVERFALRNSAFGVDVYGETEYKARYLHAGFSGKWTGGPWQIRAGYQYQRLNRDDIDDIIERRGGSAYKSNHVVVGEIAYRVLKNVSLFGRGQYMSNQFVGEIPLAYNTFTARRFDKHYGIVSAGIVIDF
ncbi:hypothetical protein Q8A64_05605 [Oxalobacteraceae bacterium R-40]|uniref:Porin domain-containing protein n=1 Tax=Keguizhuia sedimenti TaxID=3064264 RepID=A0ABU1BM30_9BURK|nr:hypothetical protein [Oxalobacteraceae bacterium R-40]